MKQHAIISECGEYRYRLSRQWSDAGPCVFIMLNPSTADAQQDDATIRRCIRYATDWGYGELIVVNLFALRATEPKDMMAAENPTGPDNMQYVKDVASHVTHGDLFNQPGPVVCAWGAHGGYMDQAETVLRWLEELEVTPMALAVTKEGQPRHPLYLSKDLVPIPLSILTM